MVKSLRNKMILLIVIPILLVLALSTTITLAFSVQSGQNLVNAQMQEMARNYANQYDTKMGSNQMIGQMLAEMMEKYSSDNRQEVMDILHNLLVKNPEGLGFYVAYEPNAFDGQDAKYANTPGHDSTGRFLPYWNKLSGSESLDPITDIDISDFYLIPKNTKKGVILDPYIYQGTLLTSFISPILKDDGSFAGIAGVDVSLNSIDQEISSIKILKTGYAFMVSNGGVYVSSPDKEAIGSLTLAQQAKDIGDENMTVLANDIQQGKDGSIDTTDPILKEPVRMFYAPIKTAGWSLVIVAPTDEMLEDVYNLRNILLLVGVVSLVILSIIVILIASSIIRPVTSLKAAAVKIANGDLDVSVGVSSRDELGQMAQAFNEMVASWREMARHMTSIAGGDLTLDVKAKSEKDIMGDAFVQMIANLQSTLTEVSNNASELDHASVQLANSADQAGRATSQIADTIQQVAQGITQQSEAVNKTAVSAEQMERAISGVARGAQEQSNAVSKSANITLQISTAIQEVTEKAQTSATGAAEAAETARKGAATIDETITGMESIKHRVGLSAEKVQEMGKHSDQIGAIIETIDDIASQTNLLALNAAIEAARAGEHGKGFSVVADEVRKLAERSSIATKEIGTLVRDIQKAVAEAVVTMDESAAEVEKGVVHAGQSGDALTSILEAVEMVSRQVEDIAQAAQRISSSSNELVTSMDAVSAVVEENTASTEQMSASSNEVTHAVESIASVSEENSAAVEEVSASTEEMSAQVEEVTASSASLAEMARNLSDLVSRFKLG